MAVERPHPPESFLSRWSRRKLAAARTPADPAEAVPSAGTTTARPLPEAQAAAAVPAAASASAPAGPEALPPVESLTFESDFTPFLAPGVEPQVQRAALRKLLRDPRFNTMDGLDVYIDDYTKPSPLDPAVARTLQHAKALFAPTRTRVNEQGFVEDVPDEPVAEPDALAAPPPAADLQAPPADDAEPMSAASATTTKSP